MIFSGVVAPRISAGVNSIQFLRRSSRSCIRNAAACETTGAPTGAPTGTGMSTTGPLKLTDDGACKVLPKSSDSSGSGESDGILEKTVLLPGEENKMACPRRDAARWAWAEKTAINMAAAKSNTHFKYAKLKPISNYQINQLDTLRQK